MQTNVKQYKEEIYAQVRKYMVKSDEKQHNAGQLSFLKGLFVSNLAIAAPVKVRHAENILDHLKHTIFNLPAADLRLMFDQKKNIESFIDSAYGEELSKIPGDWEVNEEECLPFLLIQEAQAKMEQALLYYIAAKKEKEWAIIEEEKEKEEARKKNRDFLELLYSTALYEIFLREFEQKLRREPVYARFQVDVQEDLLPEEVRVAFEGLIRIPLLLFYEQCVLYYTKHMLNLFAVLRILILVESVSLSSIRTGYGGKSHTFSDCAASWKEYIEKWENMDLLLPLNNNRNLYVPQNVLYRVCQDYDICPQPKKKQQGEEERACDFDKELMQYLEAVQVRQRQKQEERNLWELASQMAQPIVSAMEEILAIQENAKAQKAKNARNGHMDDMDTK